MVLWGKIEPLLPLVEKPARYIGNEQGIVIKDHTGRGKFALAFPEVYEIGASHFGGKIIYNIVNHEDELLCERVYMPWVDMVDLMRSKRLPLFSLETKTPIANFDVLGFTLEHELSYTNILEMLDLSFIPIFSKNRTEMHPIVIGGGVGTLNPEPVAPFFDAFYIGDAEVSFVDLLKYIQENRSSLTRTELLAKLANMPGIYVPSFYKPIFNNGNFDGYTIYEGASYPVKALIAKELKDEFYPKPPIVPWIEVIHHRLRTEINRGCGRSCRFCNACFAYRPVREREVNSIANELKTNYKLTGWGDIGLLSLSTTDYSQIHPLLYQLSEWIKNNNIDFSFPSIRIDEINEPVFEILSSTRKSGLTFAPEAGTKRLRSVINKPLDEEKFFQTVESAFQRGWKTIKLYYMIGLPTETDEDISEINNMLGQVALIARRYHAKVRVTISPFVLKPHIPFQWEKQINEEEIRHKTNIIKKVAPRNVEILTKKPELSVIEGIIARGDRRLSQVIYDTWSNGAINAAWDEYFKPELFFNAMKKHGLSKEQFLRERNIDEKLPWDAIDKGISKNNLVEERNRGLRAQETSPCFERNCEKCRFCDIPPQRFAKPAQIKSVEKKEPVVYGRKPKKQATNSGSSFKVIRIKYSRTGILRFVGHLDTIKIWERAIRISNFPVAFTEGYHRRLKLTFGPPLPLGSESTGEYVDIFVTNSISDSKLKELGHKLPKGFQILSHKIYKIKPKALQTTVDSSLWHCIIPLPNENLRKALKWIESSYEIIIKRRNKDMDIRRLFLSWRLRDDNTLDLLLAAGDRGSVRPQELLAAASVNDETIAESRFTRIELLIRRRNEWVNPMEEIQSISF